jgi:hypothetical protein
MRGIASSVLVFATVALTYNVITSRVLASSNGRLAQRTFVPAPVSWWECQAEAQTRGNDGPSVGSGVARLLDDAKRVALSECLKDSKGAVCVIVICHHPCQEDCGG